MRTERIDGGRVLRGLIAAAALVIVTAGLRAAQPVVVPVLVAAFVSLACLPALNRLRALRVPAWLAVTIIVLGLVLLVTAVGAFVGASLTAFVQQLPSYEARFEGQVAALLDWLARQGIRVPERAALLEAVNPGTVLGLAATFLGGVGGVLTNGVLILLAVAFILLEASSFRAKLRRAFGVPEATFPQVRAFTEGIKQYLFIKTLVSLLTGIFVAVWLAVQGVHFPLLWGLIAFLLNYIPNIGSIVAAIPAVIFALAQLGLGPALVAALGFLIINMVMGNIIEPRWMGHGMGLSPLVVFFCLIVWGWVLGMVGVLLSVPLTMTLKVALESSPETRWLAVLLGPENAPNDAPELEQAGVDTDVLDAVT